VAEDRAVRSGWVTFAAVIALVAGGYDVRTLEGRAWTVRDQIRAHKIAGSVERQVAAIARAGADEVRWAVPDRDVADASIRHFRPWDRSRSTAAPSRSAPPSAPCTSARRRPLRVSRNTRTLHASPK
jgi:hypothetical protein